MPRRCKTVSKFFLAGLLLTLPAGTTFANNELPKSTPDGLVLIDSKKVDAVYWRQGETLKPYTRVMILDCHVSFEKNWQREYNRNQSSPQNHVTAEQLTRIGNELATEFNKVFTKELQDRGGYEVVDAPADDVLLLRPSIIDLQISAPDLKTAGVSMNFVTSAGAMTLYLELYDGATNAIIGRVVDAQQDSPGGRAERADSYSNRAAADRILRKWARLLREALDDAKKVK